jgi:phosphoglucomutase
VAHKQGIRILFTDGSRVVFRLSGTAGSGATVRMYLEQYEPEPARVDAPAREVMQEIVDVALQLSRVH